MCCQYGFCNCFSDEIRGKCQKVVAAISVIFSIMGVVTVVFGILAQKNLPAPILNAIPEFRIFEDPRMGFEPMNQNFLIIVFGLFIVILSILGLALAKYTNPFLAIPFGFMISIYGLVLFIVGLFSISTLIISESQVLATMCKNGSSFDTEYEQIIGKTVCSQFCPCDPVRFANWQATISDKETRQNMRTFTMLGNEDIDNRVNGLRARNVVFVAAKQGETSYNSFRECYNQVIDQYGYKKETL